MIIIPKRTPFDVADEELSVGAYIRWPGSGGWHIVREVFSTYLLALDKVHGVRSEPLKTRLSNVAWIEAVSSERETLDEWWDRVLS